MTRIYPALLLVPLALAACSGGKDKETEPEDRASESTAQVEPGATPSPNLANAIPSAFTGIWDSTESKCAADSITRMDLAPREISFYESYGQATRIKVTSPKEIMVSFNMQGEGEEWVMKRIFTLSDNGRMLTPASIEGEEQLPTVTLQKCAA